MPLITIDPTAIPVGQRTELAKQFGRQLQLGRPATGAEIKADIVRYVKAVVDRNSLEEQEAALVPAVAVDPNA